MTQEAELELFNEADWAVLNPRLMTYAESVIFKKLWRTPAGTLPKGFEAPDLVLTSVQKTLEWIRTGEERDGCRKWNRTAHPDLESHLRSVIDSEASNLVESAEHRKTNYSAKATSEDAETIFEKQINSVASEQPPNHENGPDVKEDEVEAIFEQLYEKFEGDDVAQTVLLSYQCQAEKYDVVKPGRVAEDTEIDIKDVRNAVKRIRRVALEIRTEYVVKNGGASDE